MGVYRRRNLTFTNAEEEAAFKGSLEVEVVQMLLYFSGSGTVLCGITWAQILQAELARNDRSFPWPWTHPDARLLSFSAAFTILLSGTLTVIACLSRLRGRLQRLNFELVTVIYSWTLICVVFFCSKFHSAQACGVEPFHVWLPKEMHDGEIMCILTVLAAVISVCLFIPIRSHIMWLVPFAGAVVFPLISGAVGTTMPSSMPHISVLIMLLCVFLLVGGRRHELSARRKWRAMKDALERDLVARGLEEMSWLSIDILMRLDGCGHIIMSGPKQDAFFGQSVQGKLFVDLVGEIDREHLSELLSKAKSLFEVQSMPASFELSFASVRAQLAILGVNGAETCFLVGISQVETTHTEERSMTQLHPIAEELPTHSPSEVGASMMSTATEKVFNDIDRLAHVWAESSDAGIREVFGHLVDMGVREHWLVPTSEVTVLNPCVVLGLASFGCVALGRFRGTTVAIKAPRANSMRSTAKTVATLANELRLLRRVRHSRIVAFHGAAIDPASGQLAMIFEYVEGKQMDEFVMQAHTQLVRREIPLLKLLIDIASALTYLHSASPPIVHGDIKCCNIKVQILDDGVASAKLLDFGLSRLGTRRAKPLGGTVPWMAPELFTVGTRPSPSADVYSFGLLAHFTTTGISPTESYDKNNHRSRYDRLPWPKTTVLRDMSQKICRSCLSLHAVKRPTMQEILTQLLTMIECSRENFKEIGNSVVGMLAPVVCWDEGMQALRDRVDALEKGEQRSNQRGGGQAEACVPKEPDSRRHSTPAALEQSVQGAAQDDADVRPPSDALGENDALAIIGL